MKTENSLMLDEVQPYLSALAERIARLESDRRHDDLRIDDVRQEVEKVKRQIITPMWERMRVSTGVGGATVTNVEDTVCTCGHKYQDHMHVFGHRYFYDLLGVTHCFKCNCALFDRAGEKK